MPPKRHKLEREVVLEKQLRDAKLQVLKNLQELRSKQKQACGSRAPLPLKPQPRIHSAQQHW